MLNPIEKSIGATARDYSTIAAWEIDTDDNCVTGFGSGDYSDPCSPVGVMYDDADFSENVSIGGADASEDYHRKLTVAIGERHDGAFPKSPVGVTITGQFYIASYDDWFELEWPIIYAATLGITSLFFIEYLHNTSTSYIRNIIVDNADYSAIGQNDGGLSYTIEISNSIFIARRGGGDYAIDMDASPSTINFRNCVGYNTGDGHGCDRGNYYNCVGIAGGSSRNAFGVASGDYNIGGKIGGSTDTTAPGANSIDSIDPADLFADITDGAEDLHLLSGTTAAAGAGTDLSAYFTIDIDGDTRSNWDIGADEWVSGGGTTHEGSLSLATACTLSNTPAATYEAAISYAATGGISEAGAADLQASLSLAAEIAQTPSAGATILTTVALTGAAGLSSSTVATLAASISLPTTADMLANYGNIVTAALALEAVGAFTADMQAEYQAALNLISQAGASSAGAATISAQVLFDLQTALAAAFEANAYDVSTSFVCSAALAVDNYAELAAALTFATGTVIDATVLQDVFASVSLQTLAALAATYPGDLVTALKVLAIFRAKDPGATFIAKDPTATFN